MPASNYWEKKVLEATLEGANLTAPTKLFLALTESAITKSMNGTELEEAGKAAELTYEGYARVEVKCEAATWTVTEGSGETTPSKRVNAAIITLKLNTGVTGKDVAKYWALCDLVTKGNVIVFGKLSEELAIVKAILKVEIPISELSIGAE